MKAFKITIICLSLSLIGILFNACGPTKPQIFKQNPAFAEHISGYTSGMISRQSSIRIELADIVGDSSDIQEFKKPDSTLLEGIFSFEPEIKGTTIWVNSRTIDFIPDEPLPEGQFYNASFDLEKVAEVSSDLESFPFQFSTYQQKLFVEVYGLKNKDNYNIEWQYIDGTLKTSDFADSAALVKTLKATQNGKNLPVKIIPSYEENTMHFYIDSVERKMTREKVIITWNGKEINCLSKGQKIIETSPLGDFTVESAQVRDNEDQSIELLFTEPILLNQNLKGIITLQGVSNLTFKIEYNNVTVYLPNREIGDRKLEVSTGIKNMKGYNMLESYSTELTFEEPKPLVRLKGKGSILPNSNGLIFPFEAVSLKAVDVRVVKIFENNIHNFLQVNNLDGDDGLTRYGKVIIKKKISLEYDKSMNLKEWNKHVIDLGKLISPDPGAIYRVSIKFKKEYAICDCSESEENTEEPSDEEVDYSWTERLWDSYGFDDGFDTWWGYSDAESPCSEDYYRGKAVSRNILASDLGMIYKLDESKMSHAFINNMITTEPMSNVEIQYFDFTKQMIAQGKTDENGMLDISLKEKPFLMVAKHGKQRGYLKLSDGWTNSLSKFDVDGEKVQKGIKGFIYGERGVWRPGDSLYLGFILENKDHLLPEFHPVKFELIDPNGQIIQQMTKTKSVDGIYDFRTMVQREAPTGNYAAVISVGNRTFSKNLKIETIKPNRLKINLDIDKAKSQDTFALMKVKWLHGAIAKNLNATVNVSVQMSHTVFNQYKTYEFDSPIRNYATNEEVIFDGKLNNYGEAKIKAQLNVGTNAPGMLRATYTTKVFEESGDFSIDRATRKYSPFKTYVGIQTPVVKGFDNSLETGTRYKMNIVTLSEDGNLKTTEKLQVKVYRLQWRWWYEQDEEDIADFVSRNGTLMMSDTILSAPNGKAFFPFKIDYPDYGRYLVTVTDLEGNHQTGKIVTVDWPYLSRGNRTDNENANMLNFSCDKERYNTGDKIKLSIPSPANGRALISIETRSKVLKKYWIKTQKGETYHELIASDEMAPNAYIHVTLIQPHANTKNDLPIRLYGIVPVFVDDPKTHIYPEISMKDEIRPESSTTIKIKEEHGKSMTYTLAIVDEGLLDLTRYKTPDPWSSFYAKEALGVKTWDMYDDVIGAYAGKLDKLLSIGGDGELNYGKGNKANRFKPMVKFVGVFHLEAGQSKTHTIEIPNYIGSVRVMVVARNEAAYGSSEKTVTVKKPLMVLATLPRVVGPTETVYLPVNVFAMEKTVKDVKIEISTNEFFKIDGKTTQTMQFKEIGDDIVNFKLKVASKIGIAKVKIIATSGNEKAIDEIEIDVRPSNPVMYDETDFALEAGKEGKLNLELKGLEGTNFASLEFSSLPSFSLEKRLNYLMEYPHGCIEQTTSSVFPQIYLSSLMDLNAGQNSKITSNIKAGIKRLQLFQTSNGGFSYWPGQNSEGAENEWGTNYAGHFMLEAEKRGYSIPTTLKNRWLKYQKEQAQNWSNANNWYTHTHGTESYQLTQAYRLYVLALSNHPELGAMNRLREEKGLTVSAKWRLAAAYELVGQHEVADKLIQDLSLKVSNYREISYSFGSGLRDKAMIVESLSLLNRKGQAKNLVLEMAKTLGSKEWLNTQETAYSLLALCQYAGIQQNENAIHFTYTINNGTIIEKLVSKKLFQVRLNEKELNSKGSFKFKNLGKSTLFVKIIQEGIPLIGDKSKSSNDLKLTIKYRDMKGNELNPEKLTQGKEFYADITIYNPGKKGFYKEMALTQIFPSGWEIHNNRMDETTTTNVIQYQDIRDDRVYSYFEIAENASKILSIKLNATYLGRFYLPSVYAEAMYDHSIAAKVPGKWVEVVKEN
ncbi:MAG: hypothetical protein HYR91_11315 [Flavobacteriia bacterium]|nr:hypothetical protein [Flavobacteriia bacterium]